jgi:hypothetical protein
MIQRGAEILNLMPDHNSPLTEPLRPPAPQES